MLKGDRLECSNHGSKSDPEPESDRNDFIDGGPSTSHTRPVGRTCIPGTHLHHVLLFWIGLKPRTVHHTTSYPNAEPSKGAPCPESMGCLNAYGSIVASYRGDITASAVQPTPLCPAAAPHDKVCTLSQSLVSPP